MMSFEQELRGRINHTPVIDPHSHLRPERPQADNIADIVLYHHVWIELVSAGMPPTATSAMGLPHEVADPQLPPEERVRAALPYLRQIRNTTLGYFLRLILDDLYDVPRGRLSENNLAEVAARVEASAAAPQRAEDLLHQRCRVLKSLTVHPASHPPTSDHLGLGREGVPTNLLSGKQSPRQILEGMERQFGLPVRTAEDWAAALQKLGAEYSRSALHFAGVWVLPSFSYRSPKPREMDDILRRAWEREEISPEEAGLACGFALAHFLEGMRQGPLRTIQLLVGAEVLPPHRSLTHWHPEFPGGLARLASAYEDFHFNCSSASDVFTQDLCILAKHLPNLSVAGYWWHTLYPPLIRRSLALRLDIVPANKIVAFFSDAYHAEWIYPKLKLVKQILGDVLLERVQKGWLTEEIALSLVEPLLYENAARIYQIPNVC